ncbi:MAG: DUF748 domain-containing protein, partial [Candidatus Omnitrophica bacterium]|nr:DUF748 domain-containing protein [Candidatus Omnitrophota bacterium]
SKISLDGLDVKIVKGREGVFISQSSKSRPKGKKKIALFQDSPELDKLDTETNLEKKEEKLESKEKKFSLAIGNLYIKNSRIEVKYPIKKKPLNIVFSDFSLRLKGFTYPKLSRFYVKLDTVLVSSSVESQKANSLGIKGWVDYNNKNMDVDIDINDMDYIAFSKIYPPFLRPNNLRLKDVSLSFKSNLKSKKNELIIDNFLTIERVEFIEEEGEGESFQAKALKTVISFLKGDKDKPTLHLKLMTNMDSPKLDLSSLKVKLMEAAGIGPLVIIKEATDKVKEGINKELESTDGDSVSEILKGVAENLENIFKIGGSEQSQENKEDTSSSEETP